MKRRRIAVAKAKKKSKVILKKKTSKKIVKKASKKVAVKVKTAKKVKKTVVKAVKKTVPVRKTKTVKTNAKAKVVAKPKVSKKTAPKKVVHKALQIEAKPKHKNIDYSKVITPLGDRLVVRSIAAERVTAGGLILPDSATSTVGYIKAEVLAAGQGELNKKGQIKHLDVKVGQKILFSEYASTQVKFNDETLHIVHEKDVLGIVD